MNNIQLLEVSRHENHAFRYYSHACHNCGCGYRSRDEKVSDFEFTCPCCGYKYRCTMDKELVKTAKKANRDLELANTQQPEFTDKMSELLNADKIEELFT